MPFQPAGDLQTFVKECVKSGNFGSQAEVMREALRRMKRDYEQEARRNSEIKRPNEDTIEAMRQLERGEGKTFTNSKDFYDDLGI